MKKVGLVSLCLMLCATAIVAQDYPGSGDDPNPYVNKLSSNPDPCEPTLSAHACRKAEELKGRALKNLQTAQAWFGAADGAADIGNDIDTVIEAGGAIIEMGCTGKPSMDPISGPLQMLIAKAAEGYAEGKGYQYLAAADSCLAASRSWASICRACCRRSQPPAVSTVVETNPDVDFSKPLDAETLRRLLERLDQEHRRSTYEAVVGGRLAASAENRHAIHSMIRPRVLHTLGTGTWVHSFFDIHYDIALTR